MQYVTDRLDLRRDIQFNTRIESAHFDEASNRWTLTTEQGQAIDTQFVVTCCGMLSAPLTSSFPGQETFKGQLFHTARWPKQPVDFEGRRVGVVGTGATGVQVIQTIVDKVDHLTVFVRTPQYVVPMANPTYGESEVAKYKARFEELRNLLPHTFSGNEYSFENGPWAEYTADQRRKILEDLWKDGSLKIWVGSFAEIFTEEAASNEISEFVREKMRARLKDPRLEDILIPTGHGFGTHRVPLESNYLEAFLRPNVEAVNVRDNPIERVVPDGIQLSDGTVHALDIIVLATGFDAGTGALTRIDIRGRGSSSLREEWSRDIQTAMGLQVHGYPNLFTTGAPLAPSAALCNMTTCLAQQDEWIADCIAYTRAKDVSVVEATHEFQQQWVAHHEELANRTLITKTNSWYMGSNVEGKPRRLLSYIGGVDVYKEKCDQAAAEGYAGFAMR